MARAKSTKERRSPARSRTGNVRVQPAHAPNPEYLAEIARFRLMDDDFMSKCLENAPECIELILQIILRKKDLRVVRSQTEYPIKSLQGRGVRFDVFARDSAGKEYDIEIQRADRGADAKRARYNSALMDANALKRGNDIGKLHDTYVIFITENDVMRRGQDMYVFDRMDKRSGLAFGDGAHVIYANGEWRGNDDMGRLMHDFNCRSARDMNFNILKKQVSKYKNSEEGRRYMCEAFEKFEKRGEARGEARGEKRGEARGEKRGRRETMLATAKRMLESGILALKDVAKFSGLSLAQVKKLQASMA